MSSLTSSLTELYIMSQPIIIAFDTIFEQCAIAITRGNEILYSQRTLGARGQTEIILPMLDTALTQTGIDMTNVSAWAFNRGPGAFSGIRINTAVAQALSVVSNAPCITVSSLQALAFTVHLEHSFSQNTRISAIIDARQNEVYVGDFILNNGVVIPAYDNHEYLASYDSQIQADIVVGDGIHLIQTSAQKFSTHPEATHIARLAYPLLLQNQGVSAEYALPVYLRHHAWKTLAEQGKGKA